MTFTFGIKALGGAALALSIAISAAHAAGDAIHIERRPWTFSGINGYFDNNQLQRGFQVYKEVCASCHGMKRIAFRNLAEPSGPGFPEEGVKNLAASYKVDDVPNDQGKILKRPARLSDYLPSPFSNEQEARAANNGALPPDLSIMAKARGVEMDRPFYAVPGGMLKDIVTGYQEGGADYIYALLMGYAKEPTGMKMSDGMSYNVAFPGHQIAMVKPLNDGQVKYSDGTPATVDRYAQDVTSFIAWASDPTLEDRKRIGKMVLIYLLITSVLLYFAKKRLWAKNPH